MLRRLQNYIRNAIGPHAYSLLGRQIRQDMEMTFRVFHVIMKGKAETALSAFATFQTKQYAFQVHHD